jgi:hypothetical protein
MPQEASDRTDRSPHQVYEPWPQGIVAEAHPIHSLRLKLRRTNEAFRGHCNTLTKTRRCLTLKLHQLETTYHERRCTTIDPSNCTTTPTGFTKVSPVIVNFLVHSSTGPPSDKNHWNCLRPTSMSPATYPRIQDFWSTKLLQHLKPQQLKKVCYTNKKQR